MRFIYFTISILIMLFLISCKDIGNTHFGKNYIYNIVVEPSDAKVYINDHDTQEFGDKKRFELKNDNILVRVEREGYIESSNTYYNPQAGTEFTININLKKDSFPVIISVINGNSEILHDGILLGNGKIDVDLEYGKQYIFLRRKGLPDQRCLIFVNTGINRVDFEHKEHNLPIDQIGVFKTGKQPKQVLFSPDNMYIFVPLLFDLGFQVFDLKQLTMKKQLFNPHGNRELGFAEGLFIEQLNRFFVSQMNTGYIHEFSYPELEFIRSIKTGGVWPKYIAWTEFHSTLAVSNWGSNNVSLIDLLDGESKKIIKTADAPRGLAFSPDGKWMFVASFDGGRFSRYQTDTWKEDKYIVRKGSAMRHIVQSNKLPKVFVSDMSYSEILEVNTENFTIDKKWKVDYNPNTIDITPDDRFLIVSSRGPNNPESYLLNSPRSGEISIIDLSMNKIICKFYGGNQPTGLDISNDGKLLVFSNFRDDTIELYNIERLYEGLYEQ